MSPPLEQAFLLGRASLCFETDGRAEVLGQRPSPALEAGESPRRWFPHSTDRTDTRGHTQAPRPLLLQGARHSPATPQSFQVRMQRRASGSGPGPGLRTLDFRPQTSQKNEPQACRGI